MLDYDDQSRISRAEYSLDYENSSGSISQENIVYYYTYDQITGNLSTLLIAKGKLTYAIMPVYDRLGRTTSKVLDFSVDDGTTSSNTDVFYNKLTYDYKSVNGYETGLVSQLKSEIRLDSTTSLIASTTYNYTYDQNGNITKITDASGVIQYQYAYDALGQLVREDNKPLNKTYVYVYDNAGNITAKKIYAFTTGTLGTLQSTQNYTYSSSDWGDMLTSFRYENVLSYDAIGNPTNVFDGSLGYELEWEGRQLKTYRAYEYDIDTVLYFDTITYTYNADGIRTSKTVNGVKHEYLLDGAQIVSETWTRAGADHLLVYLYDETGAPVGLKYRTNAYAEGVYDSFFFDKNLQGDIVAVYNSSGEVIGTYTYDAWGACTVWYSDSTTLLEAQIVYNYNPFRYRGYFYDKDTNLYYLQSRYYNPSWCRFINADGYISTGQGILDNNMYAYCSNNPIMFMDPTGEIPIVGDILILGLLYASVAIGTMTLFPLVEGL